MKACERVGQTGCISEAFEFTTAALTQATQILEKKV
jgi:hypothetical protein